MADTHLELQMDDFVRKNLSIDWHIHERVNGGWKMVPRGDDFDEGKRYKMHIRARNNGSETFVRNVQIRVVNPNLDRLSYYADDTYEQIVVRKDSPEYGETLAPQESTPWHTVCFMIKEGPDESAPFAGVGLYAEVVPQGHGWQTLNWQFD